MEHKYSYKEKYTHATKDFASKRSESKSKNHTPGIPLSVDFAAKQFFQILLMDIKNRHLLNDKIEPVPSAF